MISLLRLYFEQDEQFVEVKNHSMASLTMMVFIRKQYHPIVKDIETDELGQGFSGTIKNKGAIKVSFTIGDHKFLIINCHLEAHASKIWRRKK